MRFFFTLFILAALGAGGWYGYQYWNKPTAPMHYKTAEVKRGTIVATVTATGTVEPLLKVLVGSQVSGTVVRWYADFNQEVEEGFLLAELDQDRYQASLQQKNAALAVDKARVEEAAAKLAEAKLERARIEGAFGREAASQFEMQTAKSAEDAALAALHAAEAQVQASEAEVRMAAIELDKTKIRAPISGLVVSRDVDAGQTVAASLSAPTLFTIANDLKKMRISAAVSETDIGKVREGMSAEFRVDAYPERRFRGVVSQVRYAETVVDNVVTYKTLIDVDNPDLVLRPGMTATIMFEVAKAENVVQVPNAALRFNPRENPAEINWNRPGRGQTLKPRVYRLVENQLAEVPVEIGLNDGSFTQITSDMLKVGDKVVVEQDLGGGGMPGGGGAPRPPGGQQRGPRGV